METQSVDFLCEKRLKELNPALHGLYKSSVFIMDRLLANYKTVFPYFTNHTFEHSEQVINYCNILAGYDNIMKLNADEIYVLLMGASLHDVGMGISVRDFDEFKYKVKNFTEYEQEHQFVTVKEACRKFHQEFSAEFIKKYRNLFEIPSDEHLYCICQIARGHRKMDFSDVSEFNPEYKIGENTIHLPYLASLVKLADEIDITADRNLLFDYTKTDRRWSKKQTMCYQCHKALKGFQKDDDILNIIYTPETGSIKKEIERMEAKVQKTFKEFQNVINSQDIFTTNILDIRFKEI